ncbi:hypothetical protein A6V39_04535 [Candidatus Mycoplasma haematobovis]|uniref:Uncharacterized protein n=1 Tax=Candidatus Mycoplasma haematobovis TaxID=432608 RepID=A0A1A9QC51_9MOLU|nr:hypothetical protein [Candidatus Mycoplasma haematobovis]OAL10152.1 hypothetical protein A6V39_04535 [Candidatus Mycoplasma haematobovis]
MANYKLLSTVVLTIGSVAGVREYLKPRDIQSMLKWNGIRLISNDDGWKSAFYEKEAKLREINVHSANGLWKWCSERFKYGLGDSSILDSVQEYCQDNPTTIMGNIIRSGEEKRFINDSDSIAFQVAYVISGDQDKLIEVMQINADESQKKNFTFMGAEIAKWCKAQKEAKIKDAEHLSNVKKYCYNKNVKTVRQLLNKEKVNIMTKTEEYKKRFDEELNKATDLIDSLRTSMGKIREAKIKDLESRTKRYGLAEEQVKKETDRIDELIPSNLDDEAIKKNGVQYLKWWCEGKYNNDLTGTDVFPNLYSKIKSRCANK